MSLPPDDRAPVAPEQQASAPAAPANETAEARIARLEAEAAETRREAASYRKRLREREAADEAAAKAQTERDEAAAKERGEYATLYEAERAKVTALEAVKAEHDEAVAALETVAASMLDGLPDAVTKLLAEMRPAKRVAWLIENRAALVATPAGPPAPTPRGTPAAPRGHVQPQPLVAEIRKSTVTL